MTEGELVAKAWESGNVHVAEWAGVDARRILHEDVADVPLSAVGVRGSCTMFVEPGRDVRVYGLWAGPARDGWWYFNGHGYAWTTPRL